MLYYYLTHESITSEQIIATSETEINASSRPSLIFLCFSVVKSALAFITSVPLIYNKQYNYLQEGNDNFNGNFELIFPSS